MENNVIMEVLSEKFTEEREKYFLHGEHSRNPKISQMHESTQGDSRPEVYLLISLGNPKQSILKVKINKQFYSSSFSAVQQKTTPFHYFRITKFCTFMERAIICL